MTGAAGVSSPAKGGKNALKALGAITRAIGGGLGALLVGQETAFISPDYQYSTSPEFRTNEIPTTTCNTKIFHHPPEPAPAL